MRSIKYLVISSLILLLGSAPVSRNYVSVISVHFGTYNASSESPLVGTGRIIIQSDTAKPYIVKIDPGKNSKHGFHPRILLSDKEFLTYNLYIDANCTGVWGDGTDNTYTKTGSGNLEFIIYGLIPAFQSVAPGQYYDVVTVSVEW